MGALSLCLFLHLDLVVLLYSVVRVLFGVFLCDIRAFAFSDISVVYYYLICHVFQTDSLQKNYTQPVLIKCR